MQIGNKFLEAIGSHSLDLGMKWARGMINSEYTITYKHFSEEELTKRGKDDFDNLVRWMEQDIDIKEIGKIYLKVGKARYNEKFPLSEIIFAIHYSKKILWEHVVSSGFVSSTLGFYQATQMMMKINNFYDAACIYLIRGYSEALFIKLSRDNRIDYSAIKDLFPEGSFFGDLDSKDQSENSWLSSWNLFKTK
ncbi:MAG: hypothetical protein KAT17_02750 [Candidatus Aminicenantes bacterium]|nr:hypothetical protein [Candidatus Aminicenantes bacterium]